MKPFAFALLLSLPVIAVAQQGSVLYEETVKLEIDLPPEMQHMRDRIPSEQTLQRRLLFDVSRSLMTKVAEAEDPPQLERESRGMRFRMMGARADSETFTDHDADVQIEWREFMGRSFLITDTPPALGWRLTDERAEFLGYMSIRAVATTEEGASVEAWFTPEIPAPVGPARYGGLPGLILILTEDDGRRSFVAREVSLEPLTEGIAAPTRGREITREDFQTLVEERMREMGGERGRRAIRFRPGGQ